MATVTIPAPLRKFTDGQTTVEACGTKVEDLLEDLERRYPGVKSRIMENDGTLKHFVNIFVNEENIRDLRGIASAICPNDLVAIVPAIAGGVSHHGLHRRAD